MWVLDSGNSAELLERLEAHSLGRWADVVWCGEGWKRLVMDCHEELVALFPDYRFSTIEQQRGVLVFRVRPRAGEATDDELALADEITDRYGRASETVCEWCGRPGSLRPPGSLRADRVEWLTLCDQCAKDLEDTHYPHSTPRG